ncbi:hypothetical protein H5410_050325 [Solanum commersonii]|uniref:Uncharacterized protein n=1 Tax=Solanum commersonii TaxID=4109 RepID=A0A9J5WV68_SOLCO|nr:hypothetical protein H5410_050325 [Solanum commersonii]
MPPLLFVKMNLDGSCVGNSCGDMGVIRDSLDRFIMAFILPLGQGISNLAEASSFFFVLKGCVPWRIHEEVQEIKKLVIDHGVITRHYFRVYTQYINLPTTIRGLITTYKWQFPSFRVKMRKLERLQYKPP